jgi:hypothetical protein
VNLSDGTNNFGGLFDLQAGTYVGNRTGSVAPTSTSITDAGNGWWLLTVVFVPLLSATVSYGYILGTQNNTSLGLADASTGYVPFWGAQLLLTADASLPYQAITTATSYDSTASSFPLYLAFDGSNDNLATAAINFTATDKITVVAGLARLSDSAGQLIVELSATINSNNGGFALYSDLAPNRYVFATKQLGYAAQRALGNAPTKSVITGTSDSLPSPNVTLIRQNGVAGTDELVPSGNSSQVFGNYPIYIGMRGGTTIPFNGRLYQLIIRGAATADLTPGEAFVAGKSGVVL